MLLFSLVFAYFSDIQVFFFLLSPLLTKVSGTFYFNLTNKILFLSVPCVKKGMKTPGTGISSHGFCFAVCLLFFGHCCIFLIAIKQTMRIKGEKWVGQTDIKRMKAMAQQNRLCRGMRGSIDEGGQRGTQWVAVVCVRGWAGGRRTLLFIESHGSELFVYHGWGGICNTNDTD